MGNGANSGKDPRWFLEDEQSDIVFYASSGISRRGLFIFSTFRSLPMAEALSGIGDEDDIGNEIWRDFGWKHRGNERDRRIDPGD
jgi:hypothetical protein